MIADPIAAVDFRHRLHILAPVTDAHGDLRWFAYIDDVTKWHRAFATPSGLLQAAGDLLTKLLAYERSETPRGQGQHTPNCTPGAALAVPNIPARWSILVGASCSEEQPEWWLELEDDSAWREEGYDLRTLLLSLERRIATARVSPQPLLSLAPTPRPTAVIEHALPRSVPLDASQGFIKLARDELARLDAELTRHDRAIAGVVVKRDALKHERRGIELALTAYEKHVGRKVRP